MFHYEQAASWCVKAVEKRSANLALQELKKIPELIERPYAGTPADKLMPTFDQAFQFLFKQPKAEYALIEILTYKDAIIQTGLQISFEKKILFSGVRKPFADLKKLLEHYFDYLEKIPPSKSYYGILKADEELKLLPDKIFIPEVCYYASDKNVQAYLNKSMSGESEIINFKVGSNKFWKK